MIANMEAMRAGGAYIIGVTKEGNREIEKQEDRWTDIPRSTDELGYLLSVAPLWPFPCYVAKRRGCDIDKPKNLAKSITVEQERGTVAPDELWKEE